MASVRKLRPDDPDSPWVVEYTDPKGVRRRRTPRTGLKRDAENLRRKIEREIEDGTHKAVSQTVTFEHAAKMWLADCERRHRIGDNMTGATVLNYTRLVGVHVNPALGHYKLTEIKTRNVQTYINEVIVEKAHGTVLGIAIVIRQILSFAVEQEWLIVNPLQQNRVRVPNKPKRKKQIPSRDEIKAILAYLVRPKVKQEHHEPRMIRLVTITLALFTGMRRGEVLGLQWENVDLDARVIRVRHSLSAVDGLKVPKTAAGVRTVPMAEPVWALLSQMRARIPGEPSGHVILRAGHPLEPKRLTIWFNGMMRDLGMVDDAGAALYSLHTLRHAAVSLLLDQGLMPMHVQRMIGHASIKTTMDVYGHLLPGDESGRRAVESIADGFSGSTAALLGEVALGRKPRGSGAKTPLLSAT